MIVKNVPAEVVSSGPVSDKFVQRIKSAYEKNGIPQVFLSNGRTSNIVYRGICGEHWEEALSYRGSYQKRGKLCVDTMLQALETAIDKVGPRFHLRHNLRQFSSYLTFSVIEEVWNVRANQLAIGRIRTLMEYNDITAFDLTAKTAQLRKLPRSESERTPSNRFKGTAK